MSAPSQHYSICWRRERGKCNICFAVGAFGLSNVPQQVGPGQLGSRLISFLDILDSICDPKTQVPYTSSGPTDWTKLAGFTDSICCTKDNPSSNCETSGANDFIEITGAAEPPVSDVFKVNTEPYSADSLVPPAIFLFPNGQGSRYHAPYPWLVNKSNLAKVLNSLISNNQKKLDPTDAVS